MLKRLMAALLAVFCLSALPLTVLGADALRVKVVLPYYHVWKTDVPGADDRFTYRWTVVTEGAPVPEGIKNTYWDWNLRGNKEGKLSMSFVFEDPGVYSYRLAAYVPKPVDGYVYEPRTFLLTISVKNTSEGVMQAEWYLLNENSGQKVDRIDLDPSYTAGERPEKPDDSDDSGGSGGSGGSGSSGGSGGSGGSSGSGSSGSSGNRTGNSVRTGDESRIRSWAAIISVSFLMLAFLVFEDRRDRRREKQ